MTTMPPSGVWAPLRSNVLSSDGRPSQIVNCFPFFKIVQLAFNSSSNSLLTLVFFVDWKAEKSFSLCRLKSSTKATNEIKFEFVYFWHTWVLNTPQWLQLSDSIVLHERNGNTFALLEWIQLRLETFSLFFVFVCGFCASTFFCLLSKIGLSLPSEGECSYQHFKLAAVLVRP